jgi:hypothetical protein
MTYEILGFPRNGPGKPWGLSNYSQNESDSTEARQKVTAKQQPRHVTHLRETDNHVSVARLVMTDRHRERPEI